MDESIEDQEKKVTTEFRLSDEGDWRLWRNILAEEPLALSKVRFQEEKDRRRWLSYKFSITDKVPAMSWAGAQTGSWGRLLQTIRTDFVLHWRMPYRRSCGLPIGGGCGDHTGCETWQRLVMPGPWRRHWCSWKRLSSWCASPRCGMTIQVSRSLFGSQLEIGKSSKKIERVKSEKTVPVAVSEQHRNREEICSRVKTKNPKRIRHSVYKQTGEEFRIYADGGWYWVSRKPDPGSDCKRARKARRSVSRCPFTVSKELLHSDDVN